MPHLSRIAKIAGAFIAVAVVSGGIAVAATPRLHSEPSGPPRAPLVNAPNVVTQTGYVSLAPCRIAYTPSHGGPVTGGHIRTFTVAGTSGFLPQGGTNGGCGIPIGASAVALTVTTVHQPNAGYLTLYAHGTPRPVANQVIFARRVTAAALVNAPLDATGGQVDIYASSTTDIVLDVSGYYREPIAGYVSSNGTLGTHSAQILSAARTGTGSYSVALSGNYSGCILVLNADQSASNAAGSISGPTASVFTRNVTATNSPYADNGFYFTVTC